MRCETCSLTVSCEKTYETHINGKAHKKRVIQAGPCAFAQLAHVVKNFWGRQGQGGGPAGGKTSGRDQSGASPAARAQPQRKAFFSHSLSVLFVSLSHYGQDKGCQGQGGGPARKNSHCRSLNIRLSFPFLNLLWTWLAKLDTKLQLFSFAATTTRQRNRASRTRKIRYR